MPTSTKTRIRPSQVLFIVLFCGVLGTSFLFFNIFSKQLSTDNHENRLLTTLPTVLQSSPSQLLPNFDTFLVDNAPFRYQLVALDAAIDYKLFGTSQSDQVLPGRDGWLFYKDGPTAAQPVANYQGLPCINDPPEILAEASAGLQVLSDRLAERGCTLILDLTPSKDRIYRHYMPKGYPVVNESNRTDRFAEYMQTHTNVLLNWRGAELRTLALEEPDRLLFYKTDTHWNQLGALFSLDGALELLSLPTLPPDQYSFAPGAEITGDMSNVAALYDVLPTEQGLVPVGYDTLFAQDGRTVGVIGDSFSDYYMPLLAARFAGSWRQHINTFDASIVEEPGCDILILEANERSLDTLLAILEQF